MGIIPLFPNAMALQIAVFSASQNAASAKTHSAIIKVFLLI